MKVIDETRDIIWCPSQIFIIVEWGGNKYQIYARWRHDDPWSIFLSTSLDNPYDGHTYELNEKTWTQEDSISELVDYMKVEAEKKLEELFPL